MPESFEPPLFEAERDFQDPREQLREGVEDLCWRESFTPGDEEELAKQIREKDRYLSIVGGRYEGQDDRKEVPRFLKMPISPELVELRKREAAEREAAKREAAGEEAKPISESELRAQAEEESKEIDERFRKQVLLQQYLRQDGRIPVREILAANTDRAQGTPFAIMEKLAGQKIGFITDEGQVDIWTKEEAQSCVRNLEALNQIDTDSFPSELREALQRQARMDGTYEELRKEIEGILEEKIEHALDNPSRGKEPSGEEKKPEAEPYHEVLNRRMGVENFQEKVSQLLDHWKEVMESQDGKRNAVFHGDLGGSNLYIYDNHEVEFIDWEHSAMFKNPASSAIIDFGNLRARTWNNREFREALDAATIESYKNRGEEEVGKAVVSLGILRSHMGLAGFFENYDSETQRKESEKARREETEGDIVKAWEVAGLKFEDEPEK